MSSPHDDDAGFDDPELLAAMAAAFGEPGIANAETQSNNDGESLAGLIERLESSMAKLGEATSDETATDSGATSRQDEERFIVFETAGRQAGLPLSCTREIERLPAYTKLPRTPSWLRGIANVRGQILSITDLGALVGGEVEPNQPRQKIIVVHNEKRAATTALVVDRIVGIRSFPGRAIPCPTDLTDPLAGLADQAARTSDGLVLLLHPLRLFDHPSMQPFMTAN